MRVRHRTERGKLVLSDVGGRGWLHLGVPDADDMRFAHEQLGVPYDVLRAPLDLDERPRTEREETHLLVVVQTSQRLGEGADLPYDTVPLGVLLLAEGDTVSVCARETRVVSDVVAGLAGPVRTDEPIRLLLQLLLRTAQRYLIDLRSIDRLIETTERQLARNPRNDELLAMRKVEKSLVYFQAALRANALVVERLKRDRALESEADLLGEVEIELRQAIEMTEIATRILTSMLETYAAVIRNNTNGVLRVLTAATILVAVPTFIAGVYGMNVPLPDQEDRWQVWRIIGTMALVVGGLLVVFRRLRWI